MTQKVVESVELQKMPAEAMIFGEGKYCYRLVDAWAKLPEGWLIEATGVAIDANDNVYCLSRTDHPLMVFNRDGKLLHSWGEGKNRYGQFVRPHEIVIGPDEGVWIDDEADHTVTKYDTKGNVLLVLGTSGKPRDSGYIQYGEDKFFESLATIKRGAPPFNRPCGVDIATNGEIFVADGYGNARVHKFSPDGKLLLSWGNPAQSLVSSGPCTAFVWMKRAAAFSYVTGRTIESKSST